MCVCAFLVLVISHLSVYTAASLEEMDKAGWGKSIYLHVCLFPGLLILHLLVHTLALLEETFSIGFRGVVERILTKAMLLL